MQFATQIISLLFFFVLVQTLSGQNVSTKRSKFLNLLTLVRFPNDPCQSTEQLTGTCYTRQECFKLSGVAKGTCAQGLGVCCLFRMTCGQNSKQNNTYFFSPDYPDRSVVLNPPVCSVSVQPLQRQNGICQFLLQFEQLELSQPNQGRCDGRSDSLTISIGNRTQEQFGLPVNGLCGSLTSQHIPSGCLQYHNSSDGLISSFNFPTIQNPMAKYLDQLQYTICIQSSFRDCFISWSSADFKFGHLATSGVGERQCPDDHILISGGTSDLKNEQTNDRFCGSYLNPMSGQTKNEPVLSSQRPFEVRIRTNQHEVNKGFQLKFKIQPCF